MVVGRCRTSAVTLVLAVCAALSGCGAGSVDVTASNGVDGQVQDIQIRNAQIASSGTVVGGQVYGPGQDAPLQVTIVNNRTSTVPDATAADSLVAVSSPVATAGRIVGDARIPDGHTLTAGYDKPQAAVTPPGTTTAQITLVGLREPIRAGLSYPVVFTFARAGELRLELTVENPSSAPQPGAPQEQPDTLHTGPEPIELPR